MNGYRLFEEFGEWMIEHGRVYLFYAAVALIVAVVFVQIGIYKGRALEREAIADETVALGASIASLEAEVESMHIEKQVADIIECESGGRHDNVWGDGGRAYGLMQVHRPTFEWLADKAGMAGLDGKDKDDQIAMLKWAVANGSGDLWSCYKSPSSQPSPQGAKTITRSARGEKGQRSGGGHG